MKPERKALLRAQLTEMTRRLGPLVHGARNAFAEQGVSHVARDLQTVLHVLKEVIVELDDTKSTMRGTDDLDG